MNRSLEISARAQAARDSGFTPRYLRERGAQVWHAGFRYRPHPDARFVLVHREGGGEYATDGASCQCAARWHPDCCHRRALREAGGVGTVRAALNLWRGLIHDARAGS